MRKKILILGMIFGVVVAFTGTGTAGVMNWGVPSIGATLQNFQGQQIASYITCNSGCKPSFNNWAYQLQYGTAQKATIIQKRKCYGGNWALQIQENGPKNDAYIKQVNKGCKNNTAFEYQRGSYNTTVIEQRGANPGQRGVSITKNFYLYDPCSGCKTCTLTLSFDDCVYGAQSWQEGKKNDAFIKQKGTGNVAGAVQKGSYNVSVIEQLADKNLAVQWQEGTSNDAYIGQFSDGNKAAQYQKGSSNQADINQRGGISNVALQDQEGTGNTADISQKGSYNGALQVQIGHNPSYTCSCGGLVKGAAIDQVGNHNLAFQYQYGHNNGASICQHGSYNLAAQAQIGSWNRAYIAQGACGGGCK